MHSDVGGDIYYDTIINAGTAALLDVLMILALTETFTSLLRRPNPARTYRHHSPNRLQALGRDSTVQSIRQGCRILQLRLGIRAEPGPVCVDRYFLQLQWDLRRLCWVRKRR